MKKRLYFLLILLFLFFGVAGFIITSTITSRLMQRFLLQRAAESLYREAIVVSHNYAEEYYRENTSLEDLTAHLSVLDSYLGCQVWILGKTVKSLSIQGIRYRILPILKKYQISLPLQ